jgi:D-erythronate 2-dehydrogenase
MKILVIGAAGMLGAKLVTALCQQGKVMGQAISEIIRFDWVLAPPPPPTSIAIQTHMGDLADPGQAEKLIASKPDLIFHLAAIVSGEAEADFEKGYRINLDATRFLFEAIRKTGDGYAPRIVFTSSIAVFGAPFPEAIGDEFLTAPLTSYGTQKAISELLVSDYSRRGIFDGMALRMPTICVRPGKANKAASSFFSNIIREPLVGMEAELPVDDSLRHWHASPRAAVKFLMQAAEMGGAVLGSRRALTLPGVSCTVREQLEALERIAGANVVKLVKRTRDPIVEKIVSGWPRNFNAARAQSLGFAAENNFDEIIRVHVEDELQGKI